MLSIKEEQNIVKFTVEATLSLISHNAAARAQKLTKQKSVKLYCYKLQIVLIVCVNR